MKMGPDLVKAAKNMEPGVITQSGFLGDDSRPLADIIEHDEETMQRLGLDFESLVERMEYLYREGEQGLGEPITVDGRWLVKVDEARGRLPSPFEDRLVRKINIQVTNISLKRSVNYTEMSIHLIGEHHFFQGRGSDYRLEPGYLKEVLEL